MQKNLHMSIICCTFAAVFILPYCAYTCTETYDDGVDPTLLDGSVGGRQYTASTACRQHTSRRHHTDGEAETAKRERLEGAGSLPGERFDDHDG